MEHRDNKLKGMSKKEIGRQQKYDSYESGCSTSALEKFKQRPYQLEHADGGRTNDDSQ